MKTAGRSFEDIRLTHAGHRLYHGCTERPISCVGCIVRPPLDLGGEDDELQQVHTFHARDEKEGAEGRHDRLG